MSGLRLVGTFVAGLVFAAGLLISGMARPEAVHQFLDLRGAWSPALLFVMGAAVPIYGVAWRLRGKASWLANPEPPSGVIDVRLVAGAAIFGLGWGLSGVCPGPAIVSAASGSPEIWQFLVAMVLGIVLVRLVDQARAQREQVRDSDQAAISSGV